MDKNEMVKTLTSIKNVADQARNAVRRGETGEKLTDMIETMMADLGAVADDLGIMP